MTSDTPAITIDGVSRSFGATTALDALTLDVRPGETFGLLGHNGAGKTTTIRVLNGLLPPDSGRTTVLGMDPTTDGPAIRARTGVLTETPSLDERLSARETLTFVAEINSLPRADIRATVDRLLDAFGLLDRADDRVGGFSRGMRQRLALARTLVHEPEVLMLDEPTTALDPVAAQQVHGLIRGHGTSTRRTVLICTHNLAEAQRLCDRVAILEHGRVLAIGTPTEISRMAGERMEIRLEVTEEQLSLAQTTIRTAGFEPSPDEREDGTLVVRGIARDAVPGLVRVLTAGGVDLYRVEPAEPTLEDAYFALHGRDS